MTAFPAARLLGITQSAVTKVAGRGEKLENDQRYKLITSEK
jgi:predicted transcriptional regulator